MENVIGRREEKRERKEGNFKGLCKNMLWPLFHERGKIFLCDGHVSTERKKKEWKKAERKERRRMEERKTNFFLH